MGFIAEIKKEEEKEQQRHGRRWIGRGGAVVAMEGDVERREGKGRAWVRGGRVCVWVDVNLNGCYEMGKKGERAAERASTQMRGRVWRWAGCTGRCLSNCQPCRGVCRERASVVVNPHQNRQKHEECVGLLLLLLPSSFLVGQVCDCGVRPHRPRK